MLKPLSIRAWMILRTIIHGLWNGRHMVSASIIDQAILSAANVGIGFILIWLSRPSEYGTYVLAFGGLVTLQAIQSSLLTGPMTVFASAKKSHDLRSYSGTAIRFQAVLCVMIASLVISAAAIAGWMGAPRSMQLALWAMAAASPTIQLQEFFRRLLMARLMMARVLTNDLLHVSLRILCIAAVVVFYQDMSSGLKAWHVFVAYLTASVVASGYGLIQTRRLIGRPRQPIHTVVRQHWDFGKWLLLSAAVTLVYGQGIYFYLAGVGGEEAVARLEGPRLIVAPCMLLILAWGNIVGPMAARRYAESGMRSVVTFIARWSTPLILGVLVYATLISMTVDHVLPTLLGKAYAQEGGVVIAWAGVMMMMALSTAAASLFSATHRPALGTCCRVSGALAGLSGCILLVDGANTAGAANARLLAEAVISLTAIILCAGLIRREYVKGRDVESVPTVDTRLTR